WTENGSGGLVAVPSVDSEIGGTDNTTAFIGKNTFGAGIGGDTAPSTAQVDATGITLTVGGNVRLDASTNLHSENGAKSDSGGGPDKSGADAKTNLTDNTATAIRQNGVVTASSVAMNSATGGTNHSHATSVVIAVFGLSEAHPEVNINSNNTSIVDGETSSTGVVTGLNGVDVRAHHEGLKASADGSFL